VKGRLPLLAPMGEIAAQAGALRGLEVLLNQLASTCYSSTLEIEQRLPEVDLVIGAVLALTNATMPYLLKLAASGAASALSADPGFLSGLNVCGGAVTYAPVAATEALAAFPTAA
jgi:alanine dehydrogenase